MHTLLIDAETLLQLRQARRSLVIFDCSFDLLNPAAGRAQYEAGHIAGARYADLNEHLSDSSTHRRASDGRHPLPAREQLARWLGQSGVTPTTQVVVYDHLGAHFCGRLWWLLKWCGHEAVAVLDAGLPAWLAVGGAVEQGPNPAPLHAACDYPLGQPGVASVGTAEVAARLGRPGLTLIDARAGARFRGEVEPLDPLAGHIPGALSRPFTDNFGPDGRFKPAAQLHAEFSALLSGRDPASVVHQCGSGVSAVSNLLAMELAALGRTTLYPASWSAWCNTPGLPCAQG